MTVNELTDLLAETELAHQKSGHSAAEWAKWYAEYMLPKLEANGRIDYEKP